MTEYASSPHNQEVNASQDSTHGALGAIALVGDVEFRAEHSRTLEQGETLKAVHALTELGVFISVSDMKLVHGRSTTGGDTTMWRVNPSFQNGKHDSGNNNVNIRSTLYTAEEDVALEFAKERGSEAIFSRRMQILRERLASKDPLPYREEYYKLQQQIYSERAAQAMRGVVWKKPRREDVVVPGDWQPHELMREARRMLEEMPEEEQQHLWLDAVRDLRLTSHQVISSDPDAVVSNAMFRFTNLTDEQMASYVKNMNTLIKIGSEADPLPFEVRKDALQAQRALTAAMDDLKSKNAPTLRITTEAIAAIAKNEKLPQEVVLHMAGIMNAKMFLYERPTDAIHRFISRGTVTSCEDDKERQNVPVSMDYIAGFLRRAHVVGEKTRVDSVTINKVVDIVSLVDLHRVNSVEAHHADREEVARLYGDISGVMTRIAPRGTDRHELSAALQEPHTSPRRLVELARKVGDSAQLYGADAGNWEGYTLGEHTETVLRNFEENFADTLPVNVQSVLRLALLAHDLGKPVAASLGKKHLQNEYNMQYAGVFLEQLGLDAPSVRFVTSLIGDGMKLAHKAVIKGDSAALTQLASTAAYALTDATGRAPTESMVLAYVDMCEALLTCDGGAYTTMATTRTEKNGHYRNAGTFNNSFEDPTDMTKRRLVLKNGGLVKKLTPGRTSK